MRTRSLTQVDDIIRKGEAILCAADQRPFDVESKGGGLSTFCVLVPLMTEDGAPIPATPALFPNRGRIWWMLRPEIDPARIEPGMIWTIHLEDAVDYHPDRPEKDAFQARRRDATAGSRTWIEVIDLDHDADPREFLGPEGIPFGHPSTERVVLRGPKEIVGPFRAAWSESRMTVQLSALAPVDPKVWRIRRDSIPAGTIQELTFEANRHERARSTRVQIVAVALMHEKNLSYLEEEGKPVDAASDAQVVNWGLDLLKVGRKDRQALKDALSAAEQSRADAERAPGGRLDRFQQIVESADRVIALGEQVASVVASQPAFKDLLVQHVEKLAESRITEEIARRQAAIEREIRDLEARRRDLALEAETFKQQIRDRREADEAEFRRENERRMADLVRREEAVADREKVIDRRESEIAARLDRVIESYLKQGEEIGDRILAEVPILRRLGIGIGGAGLVAERTEQPTGAVLPEFLAKPRPMSTLTEAAFLDQLGSVVRHRGYVFDSEDQANFHISVKTGVWTVLAGPSGIGKSSLPRLYAEALGASEEMLWIPVRPDWMDDRDVIGAFNALTGRFEPAASGLVDRLIAAAEDRARGRGGIYIVCLDEMNLARVEHYFAQFLSLFELPPAHRRLNLFARGLEQAGDPYAHHRSLLLPESVRIVGTVNVDETTHFFSPKVIDRMSLLILEEPAMGSAGSLDETTAIPGLRPVHHANWSSWIRPARGAPPAAVGLLKDVDRVLREHRSGTGFRVRDRFLAYVASAEGILPEDRAIDLAFAQIILPRLRTAAPHFVEMIERLSKLLHAGRFPRSGGLLDRLRATEGEHDFFQLL